MVKVMIDVLVNVPVFVLTIVWMTVCPSPLDVKVLVWVFALVQNCINQLNKNFARSFGSLKGK